MRYTLPGTLSKREFRRTLVTLVTRDQVTCDARLVYLAIFLVTRQDRPDYVGATNRDRMI